MEVFLCVIWDNCEGHPAYYAVDMRGTVSVWALIASFNTSGIPMGIKCHWVIDEVVYLLGSRFCVCVCKIYGNFCTFI